MKIRQWGACGKLPPCGLTLNGFIRLFITLSIILQDQIVQGQARFFRSLFSVPDQCIHNGLFASCDFVLSCILKGGTPFKACGGGFLYGCCAKDVATVRSDINNNIDDFALFGQSSVQENSAFSPKLRHFGAPSTDLSWPSKYIPVRAGPLLSEELETSLRNHDQAVIQNIEAPERYFNEPECGIQRTRQFAKRIIGGNEASFGELPWQAHIRISGYQCGGVLLNRFFVATAAHCVHKARLDQILIHLGEYDTKNTGKYFEPFPQETFKVLEKRIHPRFKYMLTQPDRFDVAVLRLSHPVTYRENIVPICLPSFEDNFYGYTGIVAGWGKTDTSFGKTGTNILRKVFVPIIENKECLRWHHLKGIDVKLHFEMFCAGHSQGQMDACLGDSGGPLVVLHEGRFYLGGITSAGFGCAVDHQPGIYHKVSITSRWIAKNIRY